jgi:hypothetical protein
MTMIYNNEYNENKVFVTCIFCGLGGTAIIWTVTKFLVYFIYGKEVLKQIEAKTEGMLVFYDTDVYMVNAQNSQLIAWYSMLNEGGWALLMFVLMMLPLVVYMFVDNIRNK